MWQTFFVCTIFIFWTKTPQYKKNPNPTVRHVLSSLRDKMETEIHVSKNHRAFTIDGNHCAWDDSDSDSASDSASTD